MSSNLSENELQTYEALYKYQGARIMFSCDQVTYQGIIDVILPDICQVKLRHTKIVNGNHYFGNLRFRFSEIPSFKVMESAESVNRYPKNEYLLNILKNNRPVPSTTIAKVLYGDKLSDDSDDETGDKKREEKFVLNLPKHLQNRLPTDFAIIDTVNKDFFQAVQIIANQKAIGVSFHGPEISRFGKLIWLCISTEDCLYLFDIQPLGKAAFDKGLRQILESKSIKKVIHDCRFPSDCLAHQCTTTLTNVFDTRVADFVISMQRYNDKYKFHSFRSLDSCLRVYLKVQQEFLFKREACEETFFKKRPISNEYLYDLLKSVLYLKLLHEKLLKELLTPLHRATGFYTTILAKSASDLIEYLGSDLSSPDSIPECLLMNGIQTARFQKPQEISNLTVSFIHPQTGKLFGPKVTLGKKTVMNDCIIPKDKRNKFSSFDERIAKDKSSEMPIQKMTFSPSNNIDSKTLCNPVENFSEEIKTECLFTKPSFKQMDEIYHKLVNSIYPSRTVENVKHSVSNISKFANSKSLSSSSNTSLNSSEIVSDEKREKETSESNCELSKNYDESTDIWLKLRSDFIKEKDSYSSIPFKNRKIKFVPG